MDAYFDIVSLRAVREYSDAPISRDELVMILQAARATGSSQNTQLWRFYTITNREKLDEIAGAMWAPDNLRGCQTAIAIVMTTNRALDAGRCAQNIMLAARAAGIGSAPNGIKDQDALKPMLDLNDEQTAPIVISLGYPTKQFATVGDVEGVLQRIDRKALDELVFWVE